jgi:S1-C subfamily serine protease
MNPSSGWRTKGILLLAGWVVLLGGATVSKAEAKLTAAASFAAENKAMLAQIFPAIVRIEAVRVRPLDGRLTKQWLAGSGVIISTQGLVLTNCHVTEDGDFFRCYLFDGSHVQAHLVGQDAMTDLAVLQLDLTQRAKEAPPLVAGKFGDSDLLAAGDFIFALGSPGFLSQSVTAGVVSNPSLVLPEQTAGKMILRGEDVGTLVRWVLHDARIFGGNSGGPLVNRRGEVVGINEIGVFNLSGAIPGNLARAVAAQLAAHGQVTRGWSGLTVQPRLEADGTGQGVVIADVAPGSPAADAGLLPGDVVLAGDGHAIEGEKEKAVSHYYRLETGRLPGDTLALDYKHDGQSRSARLVLTTRTPAQADDMELLGWGAIARDLTRQLIREEQLPDRKGVWLENIRPAGPCGQAEPELRRQDVLIAVDGQQVNNVAELRALTKRLLGDTPDASRLVLATVRRNGADLSSMVELRMVPEHNITPQVRKAWLGAASQPLTPKLAARLGIKSQGGVRLTRIYPKTQAEAAGLRVGDVILALDGIEVTERRAEDADMLARQIRQYRSGTQAVVTLWRDGKKLDVPVIFEVQPTPPTEMPWWEDAHLEFAVRDMSFDDRVRLQLAPNAGGVLVESAVQAGWANLAGLRGDDLVLQADGKTVANVAELRQAREEAVRQKHEWWVLLVQRRGQTLFVEINLKPAKL